MKRRVSIFKLLGGLRILISKKSNYKKIIRKIIRNYKLKIMRKSQSC